MKYRLPVALALVAFLAGCAGLSGGSEAELRAASNLDLCNAFALVPNATVRKIIDERGLVRPENWPDVADHRLRVGFTEREAVCSKGAPHHVNESVSASGKHRQWVYTYPTGRGRGTYSVYIYSDGHEITGYSGWN